MASVTLSLPDKFKALIKHFSWVNWSGLAREEVMKKDIFERFIAGELSEEDEEFCERTGWDPLDEMKAREEYVKKIKEIEKGPHIRMTLEELDELMGLR